MLQGIRNQLGLGVQVDATTAVPPTVFPYFVSENISSDRKRIAGRGKRVGQRNRDAARSSKGSETNAGPISLDADTDTLYFILGLILGGDNSSDPTAGNVVMNHGDLPFFTNQIGRAQTGSTVQAFNYVGSVVESATISTSVDEPVMIDLDTKAIQEVIGTPALATAVFNEDNEIFTSIGTALLIDGVSYVIDGFSLKISTGIGGSRHSLNGSTYSLPYLETSGREYDWEMSMDYDRDDLITKFANAGRGEIVSTMTSDSGAIFKMTSQVRVDNATVKTNGEDITKVDVLLTGEDSGANPALKVELDFTALAA